jgi:hypothetical protein
MKKSISRIGLAVLLFVAISSATDFDGGGPTPPFCPPDQPKCLPDSQFKGEFSFMKKSISRIVIAPPSFVAISSATDFDGGEPTPPFCPPTQPKCLPN